MADDDKDIFDEANRLLREAFVCNRRYLNDESVRAVTHYLNHDEYEMAFEGLFLDLMEVNIFENPEILEQCYILGKLLGLDKESVFDVDFWKKFSEFVDYIKIKKAGPKL